MRTAATLLALAAALPGCGGERTPERGLTAAEIERLAGPPEEPEQVDRTVTLQPLQRGDPAGASLPSAACRLGREGRVLLAAGGGLAVVRIQGRPLVLEARSPVGPTGGYFEAGGLSVSIGRTALPAQGDPPALVQVTSRATGGTREFDAVWRCPPPPGP